MHKITFYPLGNADCCEIDLSNGQKLLFDYAHSQEGESDDDLRIDLAKTLHEDLENDDRNYFDVVAFTHADDDHVRGFSDFFYLEHSGKYQDDDRIIINELWVPAAMIVEEGLKNDAKVLRAEARHRLKKGKGIRVFSRPDRLKDWLKKEGLEIEDRKHLITDAGNLVPGFNKGKDGVEFFVHSPFAAQVNDNMEDRNESALILHATFEIDSRETKFMIIGDSTHDVLADIVNITKKRNRKSRLEWDVYSVPHHCSYLSLSDEKGKSKTTPVNEVDWLLKQGANKCILVSSSDVIPIEDTDQPPHRQAAKYYKEIGNDKNGEFKVTMEHPKVSKPKPLIIKIDKWGATLEKLIISSGGSATSQSPPRAGKVK